MNKLSVVAACCAVVFLSACGGSGSGSKSGYQVSPDAEKGPVVAKVNGVEIHQGELNMFLSRIGTIPPEKAKLAAKQMLDRMIDEHLMLQQAMEKKLDQEPKVAQAISATRNEILMKAYMDSVATNAVAPTDAEAQTFYNQMPALFKERKIYRFRELSAEATPALMPALQAELSKGKSLEQVVEWLNGQKVRAGIAVVDKASENLPLELVALFAGLKPGETSPVMATPTNLLVEQVVASQVRPVDFNTAKPAIMRMLANQKRAEATAADLKKQREKGKIEYLGEFADAAAKK